MTQFLGSFTDTETTVKSSYFAAGVGVGVAKAIAFKVLKDRELEFDLQGKHSGTSYLGTRVYDELVIQGGRYFEQEDTEQANPIPYDGLKIHSVIIEVNQSKNVVTTSLAGRDGTVKEYIGLGDYAITLTGVLNGENEGNMETEAFNSTIKDIGNFYPFVDAARLKTILEVPGSIEINSDFLSIWGISRVVVMGFNVPQIAGNHDTQFFTINVLSDNQINLNPPKN